MFSKEFGLLSLSLLITSCSPSATSPKPGAITPIPTPLTVPQTPQINDFTFNLRLPEPQNPSHGCDQITFNRGFFETHSEYSDDATVPGTNFRRAWLIQALPDGIMAQHPIGTRNDIKDIGRAFYPIAQTLIGQFLGVNTCWENWKTTQMDPIMASQPIA